MLPYNLPYLLRGRRVGRKDYETGTVDQTAPDLECGRVKRDGSKLKEDFFLIQSCIVALLHQAYYAPMSNACTLRSPGRARGIHHIGKVLRMSAVAKIGL